MTELESLTSSYSIQSVPSYIPTVTPSQVIKLLKMTDFWDSFSAHRQS